ncbi:MAG: molybdopterin cofactor-binding domain-containing protein [Devosia sp.]
MAEGVHRREFLVMASFAGLSLGMAVTPLEGARAASVTPFAPNDFITIAENGRIEIVSKNPELGQGIKTSLSMVIAEELDADWAHVSVRQADSDPARYGLQIAGGSRATWRHWDDLRLIGAAARAMLIAAAAARWQVPEQDCRTEKGVVVHPATDRRLGYGSLAREAARRPVPDPARLKVKDPGDFTIIGTPRGQVDTPAIVAGQPLFGIDVDLPDMVYAVIVRAPAFGATLVSCDLTRAKTKPGILGVETITGMGGAIDDGIVIWADSWWQAEQARSALDARWSAGPVPHQDSDAFATLAARLAGEKPTKSVRRDGDPDHAFATAAKVVSARYSYPFIAHATLEPQNATALRRGDSLEMWVPTQDPDAGRKAIAKALGLAPSKIIIHLTRSGGGFGRRLNPDFMVQAAVLATRIGRPVQLLWSREDDFAHDFYRPGGDHFLSAALDAEGLPTAVRDHFVSYGRNGEFAPVAHLGAEEFPAGALEHLDYSASIIESAIPTGPLRAPRSNALSFAFQGFLDEVAEAGGKDPLDFRLWLLRQAANRPRLAPAIKGDMGFEPTRMAAVLERVAADAGWRDRKRRRRSLGIAFYFSHMGYFAEVVEVARRANGVGISKIWVAADVGRQIVNPGGAAQQVEGAVLDALSAATGQQIRFRNGAALERNFDSYRLLRIGDAPPVEISWVISDNPPTGLGEPAYPPLAPALVGALHALTGRRFRSLPVNLASL